MKLSTKMLLVASAMLVASNSFAGGNPKAMKKQMETKPAKVMSSTPERLQDGWYFMPTVGLDYTYTHLEPKSSVIKKNYSLGNVSLGARIHKNLGFEFGYSFSNTVKTKDDTGKTDYEVAALDAYGYYPLDNEWDLFGTVGVANYHTRMNLNAGGKDREDDTAFRLGLGADYHFNDDWSARAMYRHSFIDSTFEDSDEFSVGVRYSF